MALFRLPNFQSRDQGPSHLWWLVFLESRGMAWSADGRIQSRVVEENKLEDGDETIDDIFGIFEQTPKLTNESRAQC